MQKPCLGNLVAAGLTKISQNPEPSVKIYSHEVECDQDIDEQGRERFRGRPVRLHACPILNCNHRRESLTVSQLPTHVRQALRDNVVKQRTSHCSQPVVKQSTLCTQKPVPRSSKGSPRRQPEPPELSNGCRSADRLKSSCGSSRQQRRGEDKNTGESRYIRIYIVHALPAKPANKEDH